MLDFDRFAKFLSSLRIDTKERGNIRLGSSLLGSQRRLFDEIRLGLQEDVHEFVCLKCRQIGISTGLLALDLYWPLRYAGTPGTIITHDEPARDQFRAALEQYYEGLPPEWQQTIVQHNRNQIVFRNRSVLQYKVAGVKETSKKVLGRSAALAYAHATECAFWGDPDQIHGLKASMAEMNPLRFYIFESTANGFNHFHEMWEEAASAATIRPIFITWWSNEQYRVAEGDARWRKYWGFKGRATPSELDRVKRVKAEYGVEIDTLQLAWYRWVAAEKVTDEMALLAEYPTLPEEAFVATGAKYFSGPHLNAAYHRVLKEVKPQRYRFHFGAAFTDTAVSDANERTAQLRVWEEPVAGATYVIGADPAYGSSANADRFVAHVSRAWANRVEQVAEFATADIAPYTFAWVIVYLAGAYRPCVYNIELNGTGTTVVQEIENLKKSAARSPIAGEARTMRDVVRRMSEFLYAREDSISGRPIGKHTLTNERTKETYMGLLKDNFEREIWVPHSRTLLDEMATVVRDGGRIIAQGRAKDDRVIAGALAVKAWNDQLRQRLIAQNVLYVPPEAALEEASALAPTVLGRSVRNYLQAIGAVPRPAPPNAGVRAYNVPPR